MVNTVNQGSFPKRSFLFYVKMKMVIRMTNNEFDNEIKYRLYRSVKEILHPVISKRNISNYIIMLDESVLPVRVFYPKKVTEMHKVIIYIHGNAKITECTNEYSDICKNIAIKTNHLVIAIEYKEYPKKYREMLQEIQNAIEYLYKRLVLDGINEEDITIMGDSTGASMIIGIEDENIPIKKEVLFYPITSLDFKKERFPSIEENKDFNLNLMKNIEDYYKNLLHEKDYQDILLNPLNRFLTNKPRSLILVGKVDCLKDEVKEYYEKLKISDKKYVELPFSAHGFLKKMDKELSEEVYEELNLFL